MSSPKTPEASAAPRRTAMAIVTRSSTPEPAGAGTPGPVKGIGGGGEGVRPALAEVERADAVNVDLAGRLGCLSGRISVALATLAVGTRREVGAGRGR